MSSSENINEAVVFNLGMLEDLLQIRTLMPILEHLSPPPYATFKEGILRTIQPLCELLCRKDEVKAGVARSDLTAYMERMSAVKGNVQGFSEITEEVDWVVFDRALDIGAEILSEG